MNRQIRHTFLFFLLWTGFSFSGDAQTGITVKATVDRNAILIGEPVELRLEADVPENELIRFFLVDSIPHFEFLSKEKIDTVNTSGGTALTQLLRITSFDSGQWVIPPFYLADSTATDSIRINVSFSPFDSAQAYHDIKDVIDVKVDEKKNQWWWYAAAGGLVVLILLLYFLLRKKKPVAKVHQPPADPYKEAMHALAELQNARTDSKQYYSSLVDIFRQYVLKKKGVSSLQKTTDDLVVQLKSLPMNKESFDSLSQSLRLSDFVKFAKYTPAAEDDAATFDIIKRSIQEIEQQQ